MIALFDADSLIFASCFNRLSDINETPFITDLNEAINKFDNGFEQIINDVQEVYPELSEVIVRVSVTVVCTTS